MRRVVSSASNARRCASDSSRSSESASFSSSSILSCFCAVVGEDRSAWLMGRILMRRDLLLAKGVDTSSAELNEISDIILGSKLPFYVVQFRV